MAWAALRRFYPAEHLPDPSEAERDAARARARIAHLLNTDPEGSWVAARGDEVVGIALGLIRDDLWGLSLFAVAPDLQGQGIGGRVLAPAVAYGERCGGGIILSTTDARAMRRYARAGFSIKPCLLASGPVNSARIPAGLRSRLGDVDADRALLDACSRHVRGAAHGPDVAVMVAAGGRLLVHEDRGFVVHRDGSPVVLAARDDQAAADLLWSGFADAPRGSTVHIDFISEGNDWAVRVALDAGLALAPEGPVFVRGDTGPFTPYLPSGAYL
jgi:GNAT superfamily N-acetyltransferase